MTDWNAGIVEEFRANEGRVGGVFAGRPMLILHSTGAKTGLKRIHPLVYQRVDGGYAVFASKAGADTHPAWFHNLVANPAAKVEVGADVVEVTARVAADAQRAPIWEKQKQLFPTFADYEAKTERVIPVVILESGE